METLRRKAGVFGAVLVLLVALSGAVGLPERVAAASSSGGLIWDIHSELTDQQNGNSEDHTEKTVQHSSDGQDLTDEQTRHVNEDGSSHETEDITYSDGKGNTSTRHREEDRDSKGNRKVHTEETTTDKDGKCEKVITDDEYDSHGTNTKHKVTRVPCGKYTLEIEEHGTDSVPYLYQWAFKVSIPLENTSGGMEGHGKGIITGTATGICVGERTEEVTLDVTATGTDPITFNTEGSVTGLSYNFVCGGQKISQPLTTTPITVDPVDLPAKDGATKTIDMPFSGGDLHITYTLRVK
jgi:hypothetical protein